MAYFCSCPAWLKDASSIVKLLVQRQDDRLVEPLTYLSASHEVFALTLIITWFLTLAFYPHQIHAHPARPIIGSYNPCFGWDYAPASYIALTGCSCNVYLTWRYAFLDKTRTLLVMKKNGSDRPSWSETFAAGTATFLQVASNTWLLLWLIGPNADHPNDPDGPVVKYWFIHTGIFVTYGLASFLAALGNYVEVANGPHKANIGTKNTVFICVYGLVLSFLVIVYFYDLIEYEFGQEPALMPWLTQTADILWIMCVSSITSFLPREPPLRITMSLAGDADDEEIAKLAAAQAEVDDQQSGIRSKVLGCCV
eukprot:TRINITY_DN108785_c0_g1_i1.p1 TRINITY_DN108785_c0_g1~~TRINITY_DN108785_c0_g1_i1.p1  ORF type:complete len:310 (+),score=32.99 TRINITY_DN108785_c0_g1_i1:40-969(+)